MSFLLYSRFFSTLRGPVPPTLYLSCSLLPPSTPPLGWSSLFTLPIACQMLSKAFIVSLYFLALTSSINAIPAPQDVRSDAVCTSSAVLLVDLILIRFVASHYPLTPDIASRHNAVPESFAVRNGAAKKDKNKKGGKKASNKKVQNADNQAKGASLAAANDKKANAKDKANKKANKNKKADKKKATKRNWSSRHLRVA
ncbi:hypothetical protein BGW80DRAFT_1457099 [Lactifluus volemus]|nr:hypothetical protein BGW80DRAFT_1457099 [Lactifluus volemus]